MVGFVTNKNNYIITCEGLLHFKLLWLNKHVERHKRCTQNESRQLGQKDLQMN